MHILRSKIRKLQKEVAILESMDIDIDLTKIKKDLKEIVEDMNTPGYFNPALLDVNKDRADISADLG